MLAVTFLSLMDVRESRPTRPVRRRGDNRVDVRPPIPERYWLS